MLKNKLIYLSAIFFLVSCAPSKPVIYSELKAQEKLVYDQTFNREIKKGRSKDFATMIAKEAIEAKRASDLIYNK